MALLFFAKKMKNSTIKFDSVLSSGVK